jgi:actin-related protein
LIAQDVKESTCKVYDTEFDLAAFSAAPPAADAPTYILPDQTTYTPASWRYRIPEILFNPAKFTPQTYEGYASISATSGVHQMMYQAITACDADIKKDLYQNIFITGGNTLFQGFNERFMLELSNLFGSQIKLKNQSLPTAAERKNACFIGGSILGSLGTFHQMWMSKQEYDEYGRGIVDRKCP